MRKKRLHSIIAITHENNAVCFVSESESESKDMRVIVSLFSWASLNGFFAVSFEMFAHKNTRKEGCDNSCDANEVSSLLLVSYCLLSLEVKFHPPLSFLRVIVLCVFLPCFWRRKRKITGTMMSPLIHALVLYLASLFTRVSCVCSWMISSSCDFFVISFPLSFFLPHPYHSLLFLSLTFMIQRNNKRTNS